MEVRPVRRGSVDERARPRSLRRRGGHLVGHGGWMEVVVVNERPLFGRA
jgi:hypothetical protein